MSNTIRAVLDPEPAGSSEQWRLHVIASPDPLSAGRIVELAPGKTFLGRSAGAGPNAVTIEDQRLSRRHAALQCDIQSGELELEDLQSSNGTWMRGKRVHKQLVDHGAVLRIGNTVLVVEFDAGSAPAFIGSIPGIPGTSEIARSLREQITAVARTGNTVLLCGPTGAGKAKLAREVHRQSGRRGKKVAVRMDEFPPADAVDMLFGTGGNDVGLLAQAEGGTFIAEAVDRMPVPVQRALRRLFVDPGRLADMNVRVVALADAPLDDLVAAGRYDGALAEALSADLVALPGLGARRADLIAFADQVVPLADYRHADTWATALDADCAEMLLHYEWPDNLTGLRRVLAPLVRTMGPEGCTVDDLPRELVRSVKDSLHGRRRPPSRAPADGGLRPRYTPVQLCHLLAVHGGVEAMATGLGYSRTEVLEMFRTAAD